MSLTQEEHFDIQSWDMKRAGGWYAAMWDTSWTSPHINIFFPPETHEDASQRFSVSKETPVQVTKVDILDDTSGELPLTLFCA